MNVYPSIEFSAVYGGSFANIKYELREGRPVIALINIADPPDVIKHAVLVVGFDPETNKVIYNDPDGPARRVSEVGIFVDKMGAYPQYVKLLIGRRQRLTSKRLAEWME